MLAFLLFIFSWVGSPDTTAARQATETGSETDSNYTLANRYLSQGMWMSAAERYEMSSLLIGNKDVGRLQKLATLNRWMRKYSMAESWLRQGLAVDPQSTELRSDLHDLEAQRSFHLFGSYGGDEIDYTRQAYQLGAFLGYIDWLDLYASYSAVDRVFFKRNTLSSDAYIFPTYSMYVRFGVRYLAYIYDQAATVPPDQNAYAKVPDLQVEFSKLYGASNSISLEVEYFRPSFYWNSELRAENIKVSATLRQSVVGPLYFRLLGAFLRDPDPNSFSADLPTGVLDGFRYESISLFGGGIGYDDGKMQVEAKYIPDRDLDRSLDWSIFGTVRYEWEQLGFRYDVLYDRYRQPTSQTVVAPTVHMVTLGWKPDAMLELGGGVKALSRETSRIVPFIQFRYRTGGMAQ